MKKNKLMSLLAVLMIVLGFTNVNARPNEPAGGKVTVTRNPCLPGYLGCIGATVILKLGTYQTNSFESAPESYNYYAAYTQITVTIAGYTSTGTYLMPTAIGESTVIFLGGDGEGVGPYIVSIYKNADRQFTLSASQMAY